MRQVGDTLIWLALILVVAGVVYFTPRLATYVTAATADYGVGQAGHRSAQHSSDAITDQDL